MPMNAMESVMSLTVSDIWFNLLLEDLTLKLVVLMALVTAQRAQTLHLLFLDNMYVGKSSCTLLLGDLIKTK